MQRGSLGQPGPQPCPPAVALPGGLGRGTWRRPPTLAMGQAGPGRAAGERLLGESVGGAKTLLDLEVGTWGSSLPLRVSFPHLGKGRGPSGGLPPQPESEREVWLLLLQHLAVSRAWVGRGSTPALTSSLYFVSWAHCARSRQSKPAVGLFWLPPRMSSDHRIAAL